jgi:hypothetical protein
MTVAVPTPRDPHVNEPTQELDRDKVKLLLEAKEAIKAWVKFYNRLKTELIDTLGEATAGTVDGEKVVYYRPKDQYALKQLEADYPDLVTHFRKMEVREVLDMDAFGNAHPEVLERYRVRAFVERTS